MPRVHISCRLIVFCGVRGDLYYSRINKYQVFKEVIVNNIYIYYKY